MMHTPAHKRDWTQPIVDSGVLQLDFDAAAWEQHPLGKKVTNFPDRARAMAAYDEYKHREDTYGATLRWIQMERLLSQLDSVSDRVVRSARARADLENLTCAFERVARTVERCTVTARIINEEMARATEKLQRHARMYGKGTAVFHATYARDPK